MKKEDIPYDQMEEFIKGRLDEQESESFRQRLQADPVFQEEFSLFQEIKAANRDKEGERL